MSLGVGFSYVIIFALSCVEYFIHYKFINYLRSDLTEKQKAYILSIKSSIIMFLIGIYFNYYYFSSGLNYEGFINLLEEHESLNFGKLVVLYFTAYLMMDIYVGNNEYKKSMKQLSGNFHHSVYILVNMLALYTGLYPIYLLHMLSELPTYLLAIGSFDPMFRNDNLFGLTFFTTRIGYHSILTYIFRHNNLMLGCSLAALALHIYWFYGWYKKYGKNIFKGKAGKAEKETKVKHDESKMKSKTKIKLKKKRD